MQDTRNNLKDLAKDNTVQIESLISDKNKLRSHVEEIKYAGHGGRSGARKMVDELEKAMAQVLFFSLICYFFLILLYIFEESC